MFTKFLTFTRQPCWQYLPPGAILFGPATPLLYARLRLWETAEGVVLRADFSICRYRAIASTALKLQYFVAYI